jgi:hypothetical protein
MLPSLVETFSPVDDGGPDQSPLVAAEMLVAVAF